jgi:lambda family phage holin
MEQLITYVKSFTSISPTSAGVLLAMFIAFVRALYDSKEPKLLRIFLESILCGALSLSAAYGIEAAGFDSRYSVFVGGVIGYLGANTVRGFIMRYIRKTSEK